MGLFKNKKKNRVEFVPSWHTELNCFYGTEETKRVRNNYKMRGVDALVDEVASLADEDERFSNKYVECFESGVLVDIEKAQAVEYIKLDKDENVSDKSIRYFSKPFQKPYTKIVESLWGTRYWNGIFEVDEDGFDIDEYGDYDEDDLCVCNSSKNKK